jgi:dethiobiotin synthetase
MCGEVTNEHPTQDLKVIQELSTIESEHLYAEYQFNLPASPHLAAEKENKEIDKQIILTKIQELKSKYDYLLIEGAGGLLVPITRSYTIADLMKEIGEPVIVVARAALGTINHTSLTIEALKARDIQIKGIILNQYKDSEIEKDNKRIIAETYDVKILATIPQSDNLNTLSIETL